jgi:hypothetical protein
MLVRNRLLAGMAPERFDHLRPLLQPIALERRAILQEYHRPIEHIYFIERGLAWCLRGHKEELRCDSSRFFMKSKNDRAPDAPHIVSAGRVHSNGSDGMNPMYRGRRAGWGDPEVSPCKSIFRRTTCRRAIA